MQMRNVTRSDIAKITDHKAIRCFEHTISKYGILTSDEEVELITKIQNGEKKLADTLLYHNIRFVIVVCKSLNQSQHRIPFDDLFSYGMQGLLHAVRKVIDKVYDPTNGFRFISYAVKCIQGYCLGGMKLFDSQVHIPLNIQVSLLRMKDLANKTFVEEGVPWNDVFTEEYFLSQFTNRTTSAIMFIHNQKSISLVSTVAVYTDTDTLIEFESSAESRASDSYWSPDIGSIRDDFYTTLRTVFKNGFAKQEVSVLVAYYGLWSLEEYAISQETSEPMHIDDIAQYMGVTTERIRQIKAKALIKLRSSLRSGLLRDFLALPLHRGG